MIYRVKVFSLLGGKKQDCFHVETSSNSSDGKCSELLVDKPWRVQSKEPGIYSRIRERACDCKYTAIHFIKLVIWIRFATNVLGASLRCPKVFCCSETQNGFLTSCLWVEKAHWLFAWEEASFFQGDFQRLRNFDFPHQLKHLWNSDSRDRRKALWRNNMISRVRNNDYKESWNIEKQNTSPSWAIWDRRPGKQVISCSGREPSISILNLHLQCEILVGKSPSLQSPRKPWILCAVFILQDEFGLLSPPSSKTQVFQSHFFFCHLNYQSIWRLNGQQANANGVVSKNHFFQIFWKIGWYDLDAAEIDEVEHDLLQETAANLRRVLSSAPC